MKQSVLPIVLAAGIGKRFGAMTKKYPKSLIPLGNSGQCLLGRYLDTFREYKIQDVVIVVGNLQSQIKNFCRKNGQDLHIHFVENKRFTRGSIVSLHTAHDFINQDIIVMDADVYFPSKIFKKLLNAKKSVFLADTRSKSAGEEMMLMAKGKKLNSISKKVDPSLKIIGEATGLVRFSKQDALRLRQIMKKMIEKENILDVEYEESYSRLFKERNIGFVSVGNVFWSEMDFEEDRKKIVEKIS